MVNQPIGNHGLESFCVVRFDLRLLLQDQMRINLKVLISHLILVVQIWDGKPTYRISWAGNLFNVVRFDLGTLLQGQTMIAKLKSAYISLIIGPRGLQCETNL